MRSPILWLALALHLLLATSYAWNTPCFEGPDENSHYEYAWHLANAQDLPLTMPLAKARGLPQTEGAVLAHHPPLYYALVAAAMVGMGRDDTVFGPVLNPKFGVPDAPSRYLRFLHEQQPDSLLFWLRMISVALGAVTIVCVHRLGRVCCPKVPRVADLAAMLTACLPMWSALHGLLNSDVLAATCSAATMLMLVTMLHTDRVRTRDALLLGGLLGLSLLTKLTTLFLGGVFGVVAVILLARKQVSWRTLMIVAATVVVMCGWMFWRNYVLYQDPLALSAHDASFQPIPAAMRWHYIFGLQPWPESVPSFLPTVFSSLLGRFGWFSQAPSPVLVWIAAVVAALAVIGLLRASLERDREYVPRATLLLLLACSAVFVGTFYFNLSAPQPQGRLLFPAIAPAAVLLAAGLVRLSKNWSRRRLLLPLLPIAAGAAFFFTFLPSFDAGLAPAPVAHRSLVGHIVQDQEAPSIVLPGAVSQEAAGDGAIAVAPTLHWQDSGAPADTRYTLYAFDAAGRVWLATHEWAHDAVVIAGDRWTMPDAVWQFLPHGVPLTLKLRRLPTAAGERSADLASSNGYHLLRR
jgi:hypothetical protein